MKCHVCGGELQYSEASLPFRLGRRTIVVIKELPMLECNNCTEFMLPDDVMARVEKLLTEVDEAAELEVIRFAA